MNHASYRINTGIIIVRSKLSRVSLLRVLSWSVFITKMLSKHEKIGIGRIRNNDIGCSNAYHLGQACHPHIKSAQYRQFECGQKFCAPANMHEKGRQKKKVV